MKQPAIGEQFRSEIENLIVLPVSMSGIMVTGATMANFVGLLSAWWLNLDRICYE
jgi:glutamate/tyrosine decarboxylase-like PLP-dependent enzyme